MGMYDTVLVKCHKCGEKIEFQSKSGDCSLKVYTLENCPDDVMININRHSPVKCECGCEIEVDKNKREVIEVKEFVCDICGCNKKGNQFEVVDENFNKQKGLIQCEDCFELNF